jgi:macrodomain Ter protein organizer (MatP/YcbG family)
MGKRVVDIDDTYEIVLGRRRAFGDEKRGRKGITLSKKNEERLEAARRYGETLDDVITRILDEYEKKDTPLEKEERIYLG